MGRNGSLWVDDKYLVWTHLSTTASGPVLRYGGLSIGSANTGSRLPTATQVIEATKALREKVIRPT